MRQNLKTSTGVNPSMFFDIRKSLTIPSVQIKSKPMAKGKVYPFYLTPKQVNDNSMVNYLRNKYGVKVKDKKTFTTPFVSSSVISEFNGSQFYLSLEADRVYLKVITDKKVTSEAFWNLEDIFSSMKRKNSSYKVISLNFIKELISKGYLQVKFNVSRTKDHGTLWKVFITDDEFEVKSEKLRKPVASDDDFFFEL